MKLYYLDSGVLIAASRGWDDTSTRIERFIDGSNISSSIFVKLETIPKASWHKNFKECEYYNNFFDNLVDAMAEDIKAIAELALLQACKYGIAAMDACHIAAAYLTNSKEVITTEKKTKPMYRTDLVKVVYILDAIVE